MNIRMTNPWSIPLVLAGIAFTLTASAYAVMAVQKMGTAAAVEGAGASPWLIEFLDRHGAGLMFGELVLLALAAAAAIVTERWRTGRRGIHAGSNPEKEQEQR